MVLLNISEKKRNYILTGMFIFFALVFCLISLVNHYQFRTYALDLGAYTNALYDYINFQWNDSTVFKSIPENLLSDHFDLYLIIFSPFSLIFGTWTLLIIQIISILFGGFGIYKYFNLISRTTLLPLIATAGFFLYFAIFSALAFDYHSNVVAAMILPWFFYFVKKRKLIYASLIFIFLIIGKENLSLWLFFICLGLIVEYGKERRQIIYLLVLALFSIVYFYLVIGVIMPAISNSGRYPHFEYSAIGSTPVEAFKYMLAHPLDTIKTMFINHNGNPTGDYVKAETWWFVLFSGGFLLFFRPQYLIMLIPVFLQKLLHDDVMMWGIGKQYAIEFTPIVIIGAYTVINRIKSPVAYNIILLLTTLLILTVNIRRMDNTYAYTDHSRLRFYQQKHWSKGYDISKAHKAMGLIPDDAIVSAQAIFLPHLSLRDNIYQFPEIRDAEYIVLSIDEHPYPLSSGEVSILLNKLIDSGEWKLIYDEEQLKILEKEIDSN